MPDVLIVGGGVMGLTAAWELLQRGARVAVIDQTRIGREASWAGAGMIPPGDPDHEARHRLAALSSRLWPELSAQLQSLTGIDNEYQRCGGLIFSETFPRPLADSSLGELVARWHACDVAASSLDEGELREKEPGLAREGGAAIHLPDLAQVRNPRHLRALQAACATKGVTWRTGREVIGWERRSGRAVAALTEEGKIPAETFVVTAGAWTSRLLEGGTSSPRIRPVRGQMVLLRLMSPPCRHVLEAGPRYIVPRRDGRVLIGSTEEHVGFHKENTARAIGELLAFGIGLVPTLAEGEVEQTWSGLRPWAVRGRPLIGRSGDCENLFVAAGHFRAGLATSPGTGRLLAEIVSGEPPSLNPADFAVKSDGADCAD